MQQNCQDKLEQALSFAKQMDKDGQIGTLKEKLLHKTLKYYICENDEKHEKKIGTFTADIFVNDEIFEIQTKSFHNMAKKLEFFLNDSNIKVTIVHPISVRNYVNWVDKETGEVLSRKLSPKKGKASDIFAELYGLKGLLCHKNISFKVVLLNTDDYRLLDGYGKDKKIRATKLYKVPLEIVEEIDVSHYLEWLDILPKGLPDEFSVKEFSKYCKIKLPISQKCLNVLFSLELVERIGKIKNAYIYKFTK